MNETMKALSPCYQYVSPSGLEVCCDPRCQKLHSRSSSNDVKSESTVINRSFITLVKAVSVEWEVERGKRKLEMNTPLPFQACRRMYDGRKTGKKHEKPSLEPVFGLYVWSYCGNMAASVEEDPLPI